MAAGLPLLAKFQSPSDYKSSKFQSSENSSNGIARGPGLHSTRLWSRGTEYPWSSGITHQPPSTCGSLQSGGWLTMLPIVVSSVQIWLLGFAV
jgi:hypothetical protein